MQPNESQAEVNKNSDFKSEHYTNIHCLLAYCNYFIYIFIRDKKPQHILQK